MSKLSKREKAKKLALRIVAGIMAALMLVGAVYMAIAFTIGANALPLDSYAFEATKTSEDFRVAIGLRYGTSAHAFHPLTSPNGFIVGEAEISRTNRSYTPLYTLEETDAVATVDANLKIGYQTCEIAKKESETDIGGYHVELSLATGNIWDSLAELSDALSEYEHIFPSYINGKRVIRVGAYPNYAQANTAAATINDKIEGYEVSVASPSSSSVSYLNGEYDTILFEYSGADSFCSGLAAVQKEGQERSYIYFPGAGYFYDGIFCFKRYITDSANGLTLINLIHTETYVEGVLPNEISNSWPVEALKAFAIMARSFAMANINRHYGSYGFDICYSMHCQAYLGRRMVNQNVIDAVAATKNQIITYGNSIVNAAYSSSQGGYSVGSEYVWVSALGYLTNQSTPWEDYCDVSNGLWTAEISQTQLASRFKSMGYSAIKGSKIVKFSYNTSDDSPYIYSFTGVDEYGNSATVTKCANVQSLFGPSYLKSANFIMAKGELTYCYTDVLKNRIINLNGGHSGEVSIYTGDGIKTGDLSSLSFLTDLGTALKDAASALFVKTEEGTATVAGENIEIPVSTQPDENGYYTIVSNFGDFLVVSEVRDIYKTLKASNSSNYVIVGKGYGHGVGASQYGTYHLAKAGATYDQILRAYFHDTKITYTYDYFK